MKPICRAFLLVLFVWCSGGAALADEQTPLPLGMTQAQFDHFVDTLASAVEKKLAAEGVVSATAGKEHGPARDTSIPVPGDETTDATSIWVSAFISRATVVLSAFPALSADFARIPGLLDQRSQNGRGLWDFLGLLICTAIAAVGAEQLVRFALRRWRYRLQTSVARNLAIMHRLPALVGLIAVDAAGLIAVWLVSYAAIGVWFPGADHQARFAAVILAAIFSWRLYLVAFRIILRPGLPGARIARISDADAARIYGCVSIISLMIICVRVIRKVLLAIDSSPEAIGAGQLPVTLVELAVFVGLAYASRDAMRRWFTSIVRPDGIGAILTKHWLAIALPFFAFLSLTEIYAAISLRIEVPTALLVTFNVIIGLIFFETLVTYVVGQPASADTAPGAEPLPGRRQSHHIISRGLRVLMLIAAACIVAQIWFVDVFAILDPAGWRRLTHSSIAAGTTLFVAFIAWEIVEFATRRHVVSGSKDGGIVQVAGKASRLATVMPLIRVTMVILICLIALLIVLSELGVNIAPILAGASVFGLAISFGSQTLVRDIVSGIFYLADDAFRVGEYIDCGKAKGTVESFTLRSVRLRHQNGPVHTIPFGQLGQITNFSRDWSTVKFALRFMADTDLEKLRKIVKTIGAEMMEDPDLKNEILEPLKMMGVVDIADSALVVRFKFTARPGNPTIIQRNALKHMVRAFREAGIVFGNTFVSVQAAGAPVDMSTGAAAGLAITRQRAEAAAIES
jgi:small-conductance mechanosensitive channel